MLLAQDVHAGPQRGEVSFVIARKGPNLPRSAIFDLERHFPSFGVMSHIWTTRCVQGLFLRDSHQGLDCMHISGLSMER